MPMEHGQSLCQRASDILQNHLEHQQDWKHHFGLNPTQKGLIIGKMFGVLVVQCSNGEIGFLAAFSGKLANSNDHQRFVPPVYDMLKPDGFFLREEVLINQLNDQIKELEVANRPENSEKIKELKTIRKQKSSQLQQKLFEHYQFLNAHGISKSLKQVFLEANAGSPPAGAGECAAPKLLQYAHRHGYNPLALAEFWWGASPKGEQRQHRQFYPACQEKCGPILRHMLGE